MNFTEEFYGATKKAPLQAPKSLIHLVGCEGFESSTY